MMRTISNRAFLAVMSLLVFAPSLAGAQATGCSFKRDLEFGSRGEDVSCLQGYLASSGFLNSEPTGYFGAMTKAAVSQWQLARNISGTGYFGPMSRRSYLALPKTPSKTGALPMPASSPVSFTAPGLKVGGGTTAFSQKQLQFSSVANPLFQFSLQADSVDDIRIDQISFVSHMTGSLGGDIPFRNLTLWDVSLGEGKFLGGPVTGGSNTLGTKYSATIKLGSVVVARGTARYFELRGDVNTAASDLVRSGSLSRFEITSKDVVAVGAHNTVPAQITGTASGVSLLLVRTPLAIRSVPVTAQGSLHDRAVADTMGAFELSSGSDNTATLKSITVTFTGSALAAVSSFPVMLIDGETGYSLVQAGTRSCVVVGGQCQISVKDINQAILPGKTKTIKIRIDSSGLGGGALVASLLAGTDLYWSDGSSATSAVALPTAPFVLSSIRYDAPVTNQVNLGGSIIPSPIAPTLTVRAGASMQRVASFQLTAPASQGVRIFSLTFDKDQDAGMDLSNMTVMVNGSQFGTPRPAVGDSEETLMFSVGAPVTVSQNGAVDVDVYATVADSSTSGTHYSTIDLTGWSAISDLGADVMRFPGGAIGQNVVVAGNPTMTVSVVPGTGGAKSVTAGSVGNELAYFRFAADASDDLRLSSLTVHDSIVGGSAGTGSFYDLYLYDGATPVAGPLSMIGGGSEGKVIFNIGNGGILVSKNTNKTLTLRGSVFSLATGLAGVGSTHLFGIISASDVGVRALTLSTVPVTLSGLPISGGSIAVSQ